MSDGDCTGNTDSKCPLCGYFHGPLWACETDGLKRTIVELRNRLHAKDKEIERLCAENAELEQIVEDSDLLFGAGWREALKAVDCQPHEAARSRFTSAARLATWAYAELFAETSEHNGETNVENEDAM